MKWFTGEVSTAIQKAISEKKVFIVFVKDDQENSQKMEGAWNDEQIAEVCSEEKCVAINITADSVPGQQFGAIYPVLCLPSTYLINNQGTPTDIIPGVLEKEEFKKRLKDAIDKTVEPLSTEAQNVAPTENQGETVQPSSNTCSTSDVNSDNAPMDVETPNTECSLDAEKEVGKNTEQPGSSVALEDNDDVESELTTQEKSQIEMLREKVKLQREKEEDQKLKEMEKNRVETGRELQKAQRQIAERQAVQLAKEIADRKAEEKAAREKVREQIRQDRLEKTKRFDLEKKEREETVRKRAEATSAQSEKKKVEASTTARLQFRLPDGSSVSNQFSADAKFLVAENFIKDHVQLPNIRLTTVYPKHEFNSEDALKSFRELGLVPNACIIVSPGHSSASFKTSSTSSLDPYSFILFVLAPIFSLFKWISSLFSGSNSDGSQSSQHTTPSYPPPSRDDSVRRRAVHTESRSNITRLRRDDDDENATWNGNSTQQM